MMRLAAATTSHRSHLSLDFRGLEQTFLLMYRKAKLVGAFGKLSNSPYNVLKASPISKVMRSMGALYRYTMPDASMKGGMSSTQHGTLLLRLFTPAYRLNMTGLILLRRICAPAGCKNWEKKEDGIVKARVATLHA